MQVVWRLYSSIILVMSGIDAKIMCLAHLVMESVIYFFDGFFYNLSRDAVAVERRLLFHVCNTCYETLHQQHWNVVKDQRHPHHRKQWFMHIKLSHHYYLLRSKFVSNFIACGLLPSLIAKKEGIHKIFQVYENYS